MKLYQTLVAGALALTGCVTSFTPTKDQTPEQRASFSVRPEYRAGVEVARIKAKLPKELRTTDEAVTEIPSGRDFRVKAGVQLSAGSWIRATVGGDVRWSFDSWMNNQAGGIHDTKETDISTIYTEIVPNPLTFIPHAGLEATVDPFKLRVEGGIPFTKFTFNRGRIEHDDWQEVESKSWSGHGVRASASLMYLGTPRIGLTLGYEKFEPDFSKNAEIESIDAAIEAVLRF